MTGAPDIVSSVREYLRQGLPVVPVQSGGAAPACSPEAVRAAGADLGLLFGPSTHPGVALGEEAGGFVEVVLQANRTVALLAGKLLPRSLASKLSDGRFRVLYQSLTPNHAQVVRFPGEAEPILEVRTSGVALLQLPGDPVAKIAAAELDSLIAQVTAAAPIADNWPVGEKRALLALAGALCASSIYFDDAVHFVRLIAEVAGDPSAAAEADAIVENTWRRASIGDRNLAWGELGDQTSLSVVRFARTILECGRAKPSTLTTPATASPLPNALAINPAATSATAGTTSAGTSSAAPAPVFTDTDVSNARRLADRHGSPHQSVAT
jgi:hypothetical protein